MARLTGKCGVAIVTSGPGLTNTVTAVKNAQLAESPILIISGTAPIVQHNRGALQDIDHVGLMQTLCKYSKSVSCVRNIVPEIKKAMMIALSGIPGPVYLEIPYDVLYSYDHVSKTLLPSPSRVCAPVGNISSWRRNIQLFNIFYEAWNEKNYNNYQEDYYAPLQPKVPRCPSFQISMAKMLLEKAKKPVLLLGSQAMLPPIKPLQLKKAILKLGLPTFMSGMSRGLLSDGPEDQTDKNIQYRFVRKQALAEADLVIIAGMPCDFRMGFGRGINQSAKIIMVNRSFETLVMNTDMYWKPTLQVHSDVGTFIHKLSNSFESSPVPLPNEFNNHLRELENKEKEKLRFKVKEAEMNSSNSNKVNPLVFLSKFNEKLLSAEKDKKKDVIVVVDGGDFIGTAAKFIWPTRPLQWLDPGLFGTLGVGGGFALAAKLVSMSRNEFMEEEVEEEKRQDVWSMKEEEVKIEKEKVSVVETTSTSEEVATATSTTVEAKVVESEMVKESSIPTPKENEQRNTEVWILYGDGTAGYSIAEVDTFTRHKLPINICIGNDSCWSQVARQQKPVFDGNDVACPLEDRHYEQVGEGYGGKGILIGRCENDDGSKEAEGQANDSIDDKLNEFIKLREQNPEKPIVMNVLIDGKSIESFRKTSKYV